jgi:chitin synthase
MVIALITTSKKVEDLPVGFIGVSLGLNYLLMFYFGLQLKRFKAWLYPLMFVVNPFFNWLYMVYGIFTAGQRTWGGPRADAAAADTNTTPAEAVALARAQGDELNVDVDTFRAGPVRRRSVPVRPSGTVEGRFAAAEQLLDGCYINTRGPGPAQAQLEPPLPDVPRIHFPGQFRYSSDSLFSRSSDCGSNTVSLPHNVESLMSEEDQRKLYYTRQVGDSIGMSIIEDKRSSDESWSVVCEPIGTAVEALDIEPALAQPGLRESVSTNRISLQSMDMHEPRGKAARTSRRGSRGSDVSGEMV